MASLDYTKATEVDMKAGGKLTEAFAANGRVYNKADTAVHDYRISMDLVDLDELSLHGPQLATLSQLDPIAFERFFEALEKSLRPQKLALRIKQ